MKRITRKYTGVVDSIFNISRDTVILLSVPATTVVRLSITLEDPVYAFFSGGDLTFSDNNPSQDTITRNVGSFVDDRFVAGMYFIVTGTVSNDGTYLIDSVTDQTITLDAAETLTDEVDVSDIIPEGNLRTSAVWFEDSVITGETYHNVTFIDDISSIRIERISGTGSITLWIKS